MIIKNRFFLNTGIFSDYNKSTEGRKNLTAQKSQKEAGDSDAGNQKKAEKQPDALGNHIDYETEGIFLQAM